MGNSDKKNNSGQEGQEKKCARAPYNFIPFNEKVNKRRSKDVRTHQSTNLLCGEITYHIETKTPLSVGGNDSEASKFYRDARGKLAVPGSTMRGLVRNNAKILSFGSFARDIDGQRMMYREVGSGGDKKCYNALLENVKAGYLVKENGTFKIKKSVDDSACNEDPTYYVVSERNIFGSKNEEGELDHKDKKSNFQYILEDLQHIDQPFIKSVEKRKEAEITHFRGKEREGFKPFYKEISYTLDKGNVTSICAPGEETKKGWVLISGPMKEKKAVYVIPETKENKEEIDLTDKDIENFKRDLKRRQNNKNIKDNLEFFDLPGKGERKPVFYIQNQNGGISFGFTPRLRLPYEHDVKEGMPKAHKDEALIDYCDGIFGYTNKKDALKSKVSFLDAPLISGTEQTDTEERVCSEPKPTSYMDYIVQKEKDNDNDNDSSKKIVTYNSNLFCLRGVKQYWLQQSTGNAVETKNKNLTAEFETVKENCIFAGKIRFKNLTEGELGLLLYSIQLEDDCEQNIGKGKPYGFGRVKISVDELKMLDNEQAYEFNSFCFDPYKNSNEMIPELIGKFKAEMKKFYDKDQARIRDFFMMKRKENIQTPEDVRYMKLNEYKKRDALPSVTDIVQKKGKK